MKKVLYPSIPLETAEAVVRDWLDVVKRRECAICIFPPKGDAHRRIEQLVTGKMILRKYLGRAYRKYEFVVESMFPFGKIPAEELLGVLLHLIEPTIPHRPNTFTEFLAKTKPVLDKKNSISFFLYDTDEWFREAHSDVLTTLSEIAEKEPRIQFLLFCEINVTAPDLLKQNLGRTTLTQNILIQPLYSADDIDYLINQFGQYWQIDIPEAVRRAMIEKVGCHTWLIKEATRIYVRERKIPPSYIGYPTMRLRLETIWQKLTSSEQATLLKIIANNRQLNVMEKNSLSYLQSIGLVLKQESDYQLALPLFTEFLKEKQFSKTIELRDDKNLWCEGEMVNHHFGMREKSALTKLLQHTGSIVKREELAAVIWKNNADYSDWSLDRLMSRLRTKVRRLGIDPMRIKTIKKVGWIWE